MNTLGERVVIALARDARDEALLPRPDGRWVFLGKDIGTRRRIEALFGSSRRYALTGKLHEAAARLREPFLDFVSEVGALQQNEIVWWSSGFAWKAWTYSDLFLLVCYCELAENLACRALANGQPLLITVEDPWLFRQLHDSFGGNRKVLFHGCPSLWREKAWLIIMGLAKRAWWLFKTLRHYGIQRWAWTAGPVAAPVHAAAAIYSVPLSRCLRPICGWHDPFLPHVDALLESRGYEVMRFAPTEPGGLESELAARHRYFIPLIMYATLSAMGRAAMAFWLPRWPVRPMVGSLGVRYLMQREWWVEIGRSSLCVFQLFLACLQRMLRGGPWKVVVFPYENQPWEKIICLLAKRYGVRTVGIQHAVFSKFSMAYFLGSGEDKRMPLPDIICASGPHLARLLSEGGTPADRVRMTGSVRYGCLANADRPPSELLPPAPITEILVAFPIDLHMTRHLLASIREAFPDGGAEHGLHFHIKPHPGCPVSKADIGFPALRAPEDFRRALESCGLVLFVGSTVGAEAVAMGRRALRYRPDLLLNVDPSEVYGDCIPTCGDADFHAAVLAEVSPAATKRTSSEVDRQACARQILSPLDGDMLAGILCAE